MSSKLTLGHWRSAVEGAATEIATYALSFTSVVVQDPVGLECTASMIGAHIPVVGGGQAFDLALVSTPEGCQALSRAILCMPEGAPIKDVEVADAVGEIINQFAGAVKRRLASRGAELVLGLPIFLHGYIQPTQRMSVIVLPTRMGPIDTVVLVAGHRE